MESVWETDDIIDGIKFPRRWKGREGEGLNPQVATLPLNQREPSSVVTGGELQGWGKRGRRLVSLGGFQQVFHPWFAHAGVAFKGTWP